MPIFVTALQNKYFYITVMFDLLLPILFQFLPIILLVPEYDSFIAKLFYLTASSCLEFISSIICVNVTVDFSSEFKITKKQQNKHNSKHEHVFLFIH